MFVRIKIELSFRQEGNRKSGNSSLFQVTNNKRLAYAAQKTILQLGQSKSKSTIDNYCTALHSFLHYAGADVQLRNINERLIEGYQRWLHERNVSLNTSSCYMRSLRSLLNNIDSEGRWEEIFKTVFTGNTKTNKRAISPQDICQIRQAQLPHKSKRSFFRDMFLFCFYALGMPFVDLAFLRRSQIKDGYIEYSRHKTGQPIRVKIEQPMQDIINRYARKDSYYLFPILTQKSPLQVIRQYETKRNCYNQSLKRLAKHINLSHLTSYSARHTWASLAYHSNVDLPVISKALGHTSTQTTLIYINDIDDHRIDDANKSIISSMEELSSKITV